MKLPKVILADDHALIVDGLRSLLAEHVNVVATASDGETLLEALRRLCPDLVITDISMPRLSGLEVMRRATSICGRAPRFILMTMHDDSALAAESMRAGASGYVLKHSAGEELITAIQEVQEGRKYLTPSLAAQMSRNAPGVRRTSGARGLTPRQREVLRLIAAGKRMKEIGAELRLSRRTVEMHKYEMMQALEVKSTAELVQYYVKHEELIND